MKSRCYLRIKGRPFTCYQLWPDNGPYAWCADCLDEAQREVRTLARRAGMVVQVSTSDSPELPQTKH